MLDAMLGGQVPAKVLSLKQALLNAVNPARKVGHVVRRAHDGFEQRMPHSVTGIRLLKPAALALAGKAGSTALAKGGPAAGKLAAGTTAVPGKDQIMTSATGAPHGTAYASNVQVLDDELTLDQAGLVQDHILLAVFEGISRTLGM